MVQQLGHPHASCADFDCRCRPVADPAHTPRHPSSTIVRPPDPQVQIRRCATLKWRSLWLPASSAKSSRSWTEPAAVEVLATAGRHVRDWPGVPVSVACLDPRVRKALRAYPQGPPGHSTTKTRSAPSAQHTSQKFVMRTLLNWQLGRAIPVTALVLSELMSNLTITAGTNTNLSVAENLGTVRLTVRDHGPNLLGQPSSVLDLRKRGSIVMIGLSRPLGVLPTARRRHGHPDRDQSSQPRPSTARIQPKRAIPALGSLIFTDARVPTALLYCAVGSVSTSTAPERPAQRPRSEPGFDQGRDSINAATSTRGPV